MRTVFIHWSMDYLSYRRAYVKEEEGRKRDTRTKRLDRESVKRNERRGRPRRSKGFTGSKDQKGSMQIVKWKKRTWYLWQGLGRFKLFMGTPFVLLILAQIISMQPDKHQETHPNFGCRVELPSNFPSSFPSDQQNQHTNTCSLTYPLTHSPTHEL